MEDEDRNPGSGPLTDGSGIWLYGLGDLGALSLTYNGTYRVQIYIETSDTNSDYGSLPDVDEGPEESLYSYRKTVFP